MTKYSKLNVVYRLQKWMDSVPGQTFLNYAYSWGASIVILGTLFKLTHLPGANFMLFAGMGTEVIVFFLSAFDRPFDKTAIGMDLPTHLDDEEDEEGSEGNEAHTAAAASGMAGGTIIIGGGLSQGAQVAAGAQAAAAAQTATPAQTAMATAPMQGQDAATAQPQGGVAAMQVQSWMEGQQQVSPELAEAQGKYIEELNKLTETLQKVSEQSARLTRDSEEMENLNRTLTGICKVYEMQLKGASQQIGTIDQINDQSRRMAQQIEQLNGIYARMIEAMTVNMSLKGVSKEG